MEIIRQPRAFWVGKTVITPDALVALNKEDVRLSLCRHADKLERDVALNDGVRVLSAYEDRNGTKFWIVTEADLSATTIFLPEEH